MSVFTAMIDALFADPHLAEEAFWRTGGTGPAVAIRVIRKASDKIESFGDSRAILPTIVLDVRKAEAPMIAEGDRIAIGPESFRIIAPPVSDALGLVWSCEAAA